MSSEDTTRRPAIRLLLSDVDGTLITPDKQLTEAAIAAAQALHAAGIALAITSGRPPRGMAMLIEPLALTCPIAGFNGGVFVTPDFSVIESRRLGAAVAEKTLALMSEHRLSAWVYTESDWFVRDENGPHVAQEAATVQFEPKVTPEFNAALLAQVVKITGFSDDYEVVAACEQKARAALRGQASAARSQPYYLDVTHARANKGEVVATLARLLRLKPDQIAGVGDMPTDVPMFGAAGFSIAMGNASDEVKAQADAVTDSNDNEGFATAVRRYILPLAREKISR
jgi:hypothetical protein